MKRHIALLAATLSLYAIPAQAAVVSGIVMDKDTEEGLAKTTLTLQGGSKVVSGRGGAFELGDLAPGSYVLMVERSGYAPQKIAFKVGSASKRLSIGLVSRVYEGKEVKVQSQAPSLKRNTVSQATITREELKRVPGAARDPLKAATILPGVTTTSPFLGVPTVRGGGPSDNIYLLDSFPIGTPFHFGGLVSAIDPDIIENLNVYTGGFPVRYGDAISGIFEVETRAPRTDRIAGNVDTNLLWSSVHVEGPVHDKLSFSLGGRRSYIDLLVGRFFPDFTAFPRFYDYLGKLQYRPDERNTVDVIAFGNDDYLDVVLPASASVELGTQGNVNTRMGSSTQGFSWKSVINEHLANNLTVSNNDFFTKVGLGQDMKLDVDVLSQGIWDELAFRGVPAHDIDLGGIYNHSTVNITSDFPDFTQPLNGKKLGELPRVVTNSHSVLGLTSLYAQDKWQITTPLSLTYGLRYDRIQQGGLGAVSPRLGLAYRPDERTTYRLGWGQFYQTVGDQRVVTGFGNPNLGYEHAIHSVAGVEHQFGENLLGKLELYHKDIDQLAVSAPQIKYANLGGGYASGLELTLNMKPSHVDLPWFGGINDVSGYLSYAYSASKRWNHIGDPAIDYEYSQPHVLTMLLNYPLPWDWKGGLKWRYLSGTPYTPYTGRTQNPDGSYSPLKGAENSARLPDFSSVDLRFEHPGNLFGKDATYYVEVLNALNQKQVVGFNYEKDYSNWNNPKETTGLPLIPFVGVELKF